MTPHLFRPPITLSDEIKCPALHHMSKKWDVGALRLVSFSGATLSINQNQSASYLIFVTGTAGGARGEKICHVEKFHISVHDRCGEIWNFSTCGLISHFSTWQMWRNLKSPSLCAQFMVFCCILHCFDAEFVCFCDLRCFVAKSVCCDLCAIIWRKF